MSQKFKSLTELTRDLDSRIRDIDGNLQLGPEHYEKVKEELELDINKSKSLAKTILYRLNRIEHGESLNTEE